MKTTHCDPRLLTRFTNRALVIGSSAALTLGLGMTGLSRLLSQPKPPLLRFPLRNPLLN